MIYRSDKEAAAAMAVWQKRLRLQDWNITVRVHRRNKMPGGGGNVGHFSCSNIYRQADISLLDSVDFQDTDADRDTNMEDTLVHELLHLVLHDCGIDAKDCDNNLTAAGIGEERAIDALAAAFAALIHRKGKR